MLFNVLFSASAVAFGAIFVFFLPNAVAARAGDTVSWRLGTLLGATIMLHKLGKILDLID